MRLHKLQGAWTLTLCFRVEVERGQVNHEVHEVRAAEPGREPNCLLVQSGCPIMGCLKAGGSDKRVQCLLLREATSTQDPTF